VARNRRGSRSKAHGQPPEQRREAEPRRNKIKVITGGQTGVDRGALDAALDLKLECGGWCPEGRLAEDGAIPEQYPVQELAGGDYRDRTRKNVIDSDGSAIIYFGEIEGGTESTLDDCVQAKQIAEFVRERGVQTLNIAGPRASKIEKGHKYAFDTVRMLVDLLSQKRPAGKRSSSRSAKQKGNGQAQAGAGNGSERSSKSRNPQFNAQRRKGLGQHYRAKHGVK
jgi:hypothetical protein